VFDYLEEKYGKKHTAQIAALSTFRPKQAIRDVCDIYEIPQSAVRRWWQLLPEVDNEGGIKAKGMLAPALPGEQVGPVDLGRVSRSWPSPPTWKARSGTRRIHAAGFVVDCNDLSEIVGIVGRPPDKKGKKFPRVVACDMNFAAQQGLLKIDALSVEMMAAVSELLEQEGYDHDWLYRLPV
jgi:DNA polymerase III alpha subunit